MSCRHDLFWGKWPELLLVRRQPYWALAHLLDTALMAGIVWDLYLNRRLRRLLSRALTGGSTSAHQQRARQWVMLAAGCHDLGKIQDVFQVMARSRLTPAWTDMQSSRLRSAGLPSMDPEYTNDTVLRHDAFGMALLSQPVDRYWLKRLITSTGWLPLVVGGHHGSWRELVRDGRDLRSAIEEGTAGAWGTAQQEHVEAVAAFCGVDPADAPSLPAGQAGVITVLLTGIVQLADWLASDEAMIASGLLLTEKHEVGSPEWAAARQKDLEAHLRATLGTYQTPTDAHLVALGLDDDGSRRTPRPLQEEAESVGDGLWFVAYPTSEGKTGAALLRHQVEPDEGLIFALPTRATTDSMHRRLTASFTGSGNDVFLSHQYASLHCQDPSDTDHRTSWYSTSTRRLLAPVLAATCDQVLAGALPQRHLPLRLLALTNHHVVLDEVHTYDRYQTPLLASLMRWWGATGTRVTVLSATMPTWQQRELSEAYTGTSDDAATTTYPNHWLAGHPSAGGPPLQAPVPDLTTTVERTENPTQVHREWALDAHARYPRCDLAVMRTRVDDVVDTARLLLADLAEQDLDIRVLHSRMTIGHRAQVQAELERRLGPKARTPRRPVLVVASPVLEMSLDISVWLMSSDLAPAASLVQRAGRLWRFLHLMAQRLHPDDARPEERSLHLVARLEDGAITRGVSLPYFADELARVADWLAEHPTLRIPEDVQAFVDGTSLDLATSDLTERLFEEIADASGRIDAAQALIKPMQEILTRSPAAHRHLVQATDRHDAVDGLELVTRLTDLESRSYLLIGGAWGFAATPTELATTTSATDAASTMSARVTVTGRDLCARMDRAAAQTCPQWQPAHPVLLNAPPVHVDHLGDEGLAYDDILGLVRLPQKEPA